MDVPFFDKLTDQIGLLFSRLEDRLHYFIANRLSHGLERIGETWPEHGLGHGELEPLLIPA